jgi:hypothetical protein
MDAAGLRFGFRKLQNVGCRLQNAERGQRVASEFLRLEIENPKREGAP